MRAWWLAALVVACGSAERPGLTSVELAGVTLADDCDGSAEPPARPGTVARAAAADQGISAGGCADPSNCHGPTQPPCQQTSMQLSVKTTEAATVRIKKVELLDATGNVVDTLVASKPSRWDDTGNYVPWDEHVAAGQTLATSYTLSSPAWNRVAKDRWSAHTKTFQLRVVVTVGSAEQTIEKRSITPVMLEPPVAT
ncbi:MAG TPA: hypothetical protein VFQ53_30640 [Kofleriaceae bacterium]|nr:hypothetical protein [Kofleriaceae bacterium]